MIVLKDKLKRHKVMTQEDKDLLLKDLCARLPYNVVCDRLGRAYQLVDIDIKRGLVYLLRDEAYVPYSISRGDIVKPYLRPMSSMTEEEVKELLNIDTKRGIFSSRHLTWYLDGEVADYLNSHHFDYRGLIEKGLAIEVEENNNPYKDKL